MYKFFVFVCVVFLTGCQTVEQKNEALVRDRIEKLKPLSIWKPTWCRVSTHLTQPAIARYREMFPEEVDKLTEESWAYTWKARETVCEVSALDKSPMLQNHKGFIESAFCLLLQTHYVNSPFDELKISPSSIVKNGERVQIRTSLEDDLGLFLDPIDFKVETKTKSRGVLSARYSSHEGDWLPDHLEYHSPTSTIVVDTIEYAEVKLSGKRMIKSFWISVGDDKTLQHTQVELSACQNF